MNTQEISERTSFDHGTEFENAQDVRDYFTVENMNDMFGSDGHTCHDQPELDEMAQEVIDEKAHCTF